MTITMTIENTTDIRIFEQRLHSWPPPPNETWCLYPLFYWTNIPIPLPEQMTERNGFEYLLDVKRFADFKGILW